MKLIDAKLKRNIRTLENDIYYLNRQLVQKDRRIAKHLSTITELEEKWKDAVKRANKLQLKVNRLKKLIPNSDYDFLDEMEQS